MFTRLILNNQLKPPLIFVCKAYKSKNLLLDFYKMASIMAKIFVRSTLTKILTAKWHFSLTNNSSWHLKSNLLFVFLLLWSFALPSKVCLTPIMLCHILNYLLFGFYFRAIGCSIRRCYPYEWRLFGEYSQTNRTSMLCNLWHLF